MNHLTISTGYFKFPFEIRRIVGAMKKQRIDGQETRENLLKAAAEVFARKGFRNATMAEICERAGANTAAANYHFGGKETLYVQSWRHAFRQSLETYPADGGIAPEAGVEERLKGRILAIMRRISDPESNDLDIVHQEMATPTGLLNSALQESFEPILEGFTVIIRELLGDRASEQDSRLCRMSIKAQCFGPMMRERRRMQTGPEKLDPGLDAIMEDVEIVADHVTRFSLAGIRDVRRRIEATERRKRTKSEDEGAAVSRGEL